MPFIVTVCTKLVPSTCVSVEIVATSSSSMVPVPVVPSMFNDKVSSTSVTLSSFVGMVTVKSATPTGTVISPATAS